MAAQPHKLGAVPAEHSALTQSRETGDVIPEQTSPAKGRVKALPFAKSWIHLMAGGYVAVRHMMMLRD